MDKANGHDDVATNNGHTRWRRNKAKQRIMDKANGHDNVATKSGHNTTAKEQSEATNNGQSN